MKKILFGLIATMTLGVSTLSTVALADTKVNTEQVNDEYIPGNYKVVPITSDTNQDKSVTGYFSLAWKPGSTENIGIRITNDNDFPKKFTIKSNKAFTNGNGVLTYDTDTLNEHGKVKVVDLINFDEEVVVGAKETKDLMGTINIPNESMEGTMIGSISINEVLPKTNKKFAQQLAYGIPVFLKGDKPEPKEEITFREFKFVRVGSGIYGINTPFENKHNNWTKEGKATVTVKDKNGKEILKDERDEVRISPETPINYNPNFNTPLKAGTYTVTLTVKTDTKEWSDTQEVTVDKEQAKDMKETLSVGEQEEEKSNLLMFSIVAIILLLVIVIVLLLRKNKGNKESKEKE